MNEYNLFKLNMDNIEENEMNVTEVIQGKLLKWEKSVFYWDFFFFVSPLI